jgi:hypothetical protein
MGGTHGETWRTMPPVVFALIGTEPASECVYVCGGGEVVGEMDPIRNKLLFRARI